MTDLDLHAVLDRATDSLDLADSPQHAAVSALARARVIRNRRRGLVAGAVAAVAVVAVVLAVGVRGIDRSAPPVSPPHPVPEMPDSAVQSTWDPRTATQLPPRDSVLPTSMEPPADAGPLPLPGPAVVVLSDSGNRLALLGTDGTWAAMKAPSGSSYVTSLSDDGTMLANVGPRGAFVTDVRDGTWRRLDLPPGGLLWTGLGTTLAWRGDTQLLVRGATASIGVLDVSGHHRPATRPTRLADTSGLATTPDTVLVFGPGRDGRMIRETRDSGSTRTFDAEALERISLPVASEAKLVGTVSGIPQDDRPTDHAGVIVLDRSQYAAQAYLPIAGTRYEPGIGISGFGVHGVSPLGWLDDSTVLLEHAPAFGAPWQLVAWDVETGELSLVSTGTSRVQPIGVAHALVHD